VALALAAAALAPAALALAATALPDPASPLLWSTVDVCDTAAHPDVIGIRGSMPGTGARDQQMSMRFTVEYLDAKGRWRYIATADSGNVALGPGTARARQAGWNFTIAPSSKRGYKLRGVVVFEWRIGTATVAQEVRSTTAGHSSPVGADPPGYSAATCAISRTAAGRL
jgi:hypothetical protein